MPDPRPTVLYIDDDPDYRDALRAILESEGYQMLEAASAEAGLAVFKDRQPDVVLVDLMMEEIDSGTSFVKELRATGSTVPIYLLSSVGDDMALTADQRDLGFAGIFQKPIDRKALLRVLESHTVA